MPAWSAWIVHVPVVSNVTEVPATVHTAVVSDENDTGSPDDADALTVIGDCASVALASGPNVIDCGDVPPPMPGAGSRPR